MSFFDDPIYPGKKSMLRLVMFMLATTACVIGLAFTVFIFLFPDKSAHDTWLVAAITSLVLNGVVALWSHSRSQSADSGDK